jgi:hypothetical protein
MVQSWHNSIAFPQDSAQMPQKNISAEVAKNTFYDYNCNCHLTSCELDNYFEASFADDLANTLNNQSKKFRYKCLMQGPRRVEVLLARVERCFGQKNQGYFCNYYLPMTVNR